MTVVEPVLLDTDVYSLIYVRRNSGDSRVSAWRETLVGQRVLIAFRTHAELLVGGLAGNWGATRMRSLRETLAATPMIPADHEVIRAYAELTAGCWRSGHGLAQKPHAGDRWVAACAVAKDIPLLAGDGIYLNAAGLRLLT